MSGRSSLHRRIGQFNSSVVVSAGKYWEAAFRQAKAAGMPRRYGRMARKGNHMYQFESRVRYSETDIDGRLSLTGIINYLQDCSTFQSEDIGKGLEYLRRRGCAWWLASWQIVIDRFPELGEEIAIGTWPYDFKGCYGYRSFFIRDREGRYPVRASSVWFYYDLNAGRPVRVDADVIAGYGDLKPPLPMEIAPRKIPVPKEYEEGEPVTVGKHHLDTNRHVNNAQYVEIARELLPDGFRIGEIRVEYKKAAVLGDVMLPRVTRTEGDCTVCLCSPDGGIHAVIWMKDRGSGDAGTGEKRGADAPEERI